MMLKLFSPSEWQLVISAIWVRLGVLFRPAMSKYQNQREIYVWLFCLHIHSKIRYMVILPHFISKSSNPSSTFAVSKNPCVGWCLYRGAYEPTLHVLGIIIVHEHGYPQWNPLTSRYKSQFLLGKSQLSPHLCGSPWNRNRCEQGPAPVEKAAAIRAQPSWLRYQ